LFLVDGMQGKSSEHVEVRAMLAVLAEKVTSSTERLSVQSIGNSLFCSITVTIHQILQITFLFSLDNSYQRTQH